MYWWQEKVVDTIIFNLRRSQRNQDFFAIKFTGINLDPKYRLLYLPNQIVSHGDYAFKAAGPEQGPAVLCLSYNTWVIQDSNKFRMTI